MNEEQMIRRDRMRFKKNKLSANLTLLAIVLDVLYFVNIYQNDAGSYYHNWIIGVSVVYNLIFMLAAFLSEEGVKNYKELYSIPLVILGVIQIVRIFILPWQAHSYINVDAGFPEPPVHLPGHPAHRLGGVPGGCGCDQLYQVQRAGSPHEDAGRAFRRERRSGRQERVRRGQDGRTEFTAYRQDIR